MVQPVNLLMAVLTDVCNYSNRFGRLRISAFIPEECNRGQQESQKQAARKLPANDPELQAYPPHDQVTDFDEDFAEYYEIQQSFGNPNEYHTGGSVEDEHDLHGYWDNRDMFQLHDDFYEEA